MGLWLFNVDAQDDEIENACLAAAAELARRGIDADAAQQAALDAADLPDDYNEQITPHSVAVVAWYAAEDEACRKLEELTGEWPHDAGLIYTEMDDGD